MTVKGANDCFVAPRGRQLARAIEPLLNSSLIRRSRRAFFGFLPFPTLRSDVRDIIYATWLIPTHRAQALAPPGIALAERDKKTPLTILSYRHGHFGPRWLGALRRLLPSPLQSNWRLYVTSVHGSMTSEPTVLFIANIFDRLAHVAGSRLLSDALPAHLAGRFTHRRDEGGWLTELSSGGGSAPEMTLRVEAVPDDVVPADIAAWFGGVGPPYATLCLQDAAVVRVPNDDRVAAARIDLPIDVATVRPLAVTAYSPGPLLTALGATDTPWCFHVPAVRFTVLGERLLPRAPAQ